LDRDRKIKVLIVDDSAIVRKMLTDAISEVPDLEAVGTAPDPFIARGKILALKPDVLTLDIEMPRMDGLTFLRKLMQFHPLPVIVISSLGQSSCQATLEALRLGAVEVLAKPGGPYSVGELRNDLAAKIRMAAAATIRRPVNCSPMEAKENIVIAPARSFRPETVVAIGASTGGTEAIEEILTHLPENVPGIVIVQHIPPVFSRAFAERLNRVCRIRVKEACDGDRVQAGTALVAPGDFHMVLRKTDSEYRVQIKGGPRVCYQRPSIDVLFSSVAECAGDRAVGVLLTGMGSDGARGLLSMMHHGARTVVQDEASCVVFGMPREAIRLGAAGRIVPLPKIAFAITNEAAMTGKG